jgi:hypothetical protein
MNVHADQFPLVQIAGRRKAPGISHFKGAQVSALLDEQTFVRWLKNCCSILQNHPGPRHKFATFHLADAVKRGDLWWGFSAEDVKANPVTP